MFSFSAASCSSGASRGDSWVLDDGEESVTGVCSSGASRGDSCMPDACEAMACATIIGVFDGVSWSGGAFRGDSWALGDAGGSTCKTGLGDKLRPDGVTTLDEGLASEEEMLSV